jgi:hypothetical protein
MTKSSGKPNPSRDDSELVQTVILGINKKHGDRIDLAKYTAAESTLVLTELVRGIIGNGGFRHLLEGDIPGDPDYRLSVKAFETLGLRPIVETFREVLSVFPRSRPPRNLDRRLNKYLETPYKERQKLDKKFWEADDQITAGQAQFIDQHWDELGSLVIDHDVPQAPDGSDG